MVVKTFPALVADGHLQHDESLAAFEGQQVQVTVVARTSSAPQPTPAEESDGPVPPDWLDVEKDVYVKMPFPSAILKDMTVVEGSPLRPCIILPEDLPDE